MYLGLFRIISAAITPGTQPAKVNNNTIKKDPQPLPKTDNGGKNIAKITRQKLIAFLFNKNKFTIKPYKSYCLCNYIFKIYTYLCMLKIHIKI